MPSSSTWLPPLAVTATAVPNRPPESAATAWIVPARPSAAESSVSRGWMVVPVTAIRAMARTGSTPRRSVAVVVPPGPVAETV